MDTPFGQTFFGYRPPPLNRWGPTDSSLGSWEGIGLPIPGRPVSQSVREAGIQRFLIESYTVLLTTIYSFLISSFRFGIRFFFVCNQHFFSYHLSIPPSIHLLFF